MEGIDNQEGGVCKTKSMKITMKVGQSEYHIIASQLWALTDRQSTMQQIQNCVLCSKKGAAYISIISMTPGPARGPEMKSSKKQIGRDISACSGCFCCHTLFQLDCFIRMQIWFVGMILMIHDPTCATPMWAFCFCLWWMHTQPYKPCWILILIAAVMFYDSCLAPICRNFFRVVPLVNSSLSCT